MHQDESKKIREKDKAEAEFLYAEANYYARSGLFDQALDLMQTILLIDDQDPKYFNNKAAILKRLGRFDEALEEYIKLTKNFPDYGKGFLSLASTYIEQQDHQKAKSSYFAFLAAYANGHFEFNPLWGGVDQTIEGENELTTIFITSINYLSEDEKACAITAFQAALNQLNNSEVVEFQTATFSIGGGIIERETKQAYALQENIGDAVISLIIIPSGTFTMGDAVSRYQCEVSLPSFLMSQYPITQAQYQLVMGDNPSRFKGPNLPVENVFWSDAVEFCTRLSSYTGREYRLPSESEWEYACRAGTNTRFHFGYEMLMNYFSMRSLGLSTLSSRRAANYKSEKKSDNSKKTTQVGSFGIANAFGLYDMHGNVWEWCADDWHDDYQDTPVDGSPWKNKNSDRILRGGSWLSSPEECMSTNRCRTPYRYRDKDIGFRIVSAHL